jgi:predicted DNA-binding transcriptional regulator AlpA
MKTMIEILGKIYLTDKEAAQRYGYSTSWFQNQRCKKINLPFVKMRGKGKVYYPRDEVDKWFKDNLKMNE